MNGARNTYGEEGGAYRVWWGNLMERDHLKKGRSRWDDNIKLHL
jgi:hypothetical protein